MTQSKGSSASLLQDSHEEIAFCGRRIVAVLKARTSKFIFAYLVLVENALDLTHLLCFRKRQHHQDSCMRRQQSLDRDNGQRVAHRTRRCDLLARSRRLVNAETSTLQNFTLADDQYRRVHRRRQSRYDIVSG